MHLDNRNHGDLLNSPLSLLVILCKLIGFLERELKKDNIPIHNNGDVPLAPLPREMIELEVSNSE